MKKFIAVLVVAVAILWVHNRCSEPASLVKEVKIAPPFENVDYDFFRHFITAGESNTIEYENGTKIDIPPECFVDKAGKIVRGKVEIDFREFHNAGEIMTSGIPMVYDSGGVRMHFQTAGMFEINGYAEGEPVFIAPDKQITVSLASYQQETDYKFYRYNKTVNNWEFQTTSQPEKNTDRTERLRALEQQKTEEPVKPLKLDPSKNILDLNVNYSYFPELSSFHGIMWQCEEIRGDLKPEDLSKISENYYRNIELTINSQKQSTYKLTLTDKDFKKYTAVVKPVFAGKSYKKALRKFNKKFAEYKQTLQKIKNARRLAEKQAEFRRVMAIRGFGIYNYDRQYKIDNRVAVNADFTFDKEINLRKKDISVYLITGEDRALVKYPCYDWHKFAFDKNDKNKIIAVLPENQIAVFGTKAFEHLNLEPSSTPVEYTFKMHVLDEKIDAFEDISNVINAI